jgi:hypothetical protein
LVQRGAHRSREVPAARNLLEAPLELPALSLHGRLDTKVDNLQAAAAYDAAARKIRGDNTKFNIQLEPGKLDPLMQTAAKSALEQLEKSRTERNVGPDCLAAAQPEEARHKALLQELIAESNEKVRPAAAACTTACGVHLPQPALHAV